MRNVPLTQIPDFSDANQLLPAVAQDAATGKVLMLAYMNRAAWEQTLATGEATYFSRSRGKLWKKGEESGNVQRVREIFVDCDGDTILLKVEQEGGAACHQGYESCFFRQWDGKDFQIVGRRVFDPQQVYEDKK
jgi:phosphoribosyl-AMP cyclohydrolase